MNDPLRDPERLRRAQDLFHALCELDTAEQERALAGSCGSDAELRMALYLQQTLLLLINQDGF